MTTHLLYSWGWLSHRIVLMWVPRLLHRWSVSHSLVAGTTPARHGGGCSPRMWGVAFLNMSRKRWLYMQSSYHFRLRCSNIHNKNPVKKEVNGHSKRNRIDLWNRKMEKSWKIKWFWIDLFLAFNHCVKVGSFSKIYINKFVAYITDTPGFINPTNVWYMRKRTKMLLRPTYSILAENRHLQLFTRQCIVSCNCL